MICRKRKRDPEALQHERVGRRAQGAEASRHERVQREERAEEWRQVRAHGEQRHRRRGSRLESRDSTAGARQREGDRTSGERQKEFEGSASRFSTRSNSVVDDAHNGELCGRRLSNQDFHTALNHEKLVGPPSMKLC
ncbi:zinc finger CCCH domain-containing protein 13-like [Rhinatrema bivittatum]|uniref:zinc finger CCCH domain-containing protein 13-like n=1 Tax=Rhinatrema bivittatum TaxID=194408 RepID=UPI00112E6B1B|nr:zinc finger CCCH domain-containing protein 13-like [Rhinatrema bivittatum]